MFTLEKQVFTLKKDSVTILVKVFRSLPVITSHVILNHFDKRQHPITIRVGIHCTIVLVA